MQRELVLDYDRPLAEGLARAVEAMVEAARAEVKKAIESPASAMHDYRRSLRRTEAVVDLAWPVLRRVHRKWLVTSVDRARRRTRIARDLDAVLPMLNHLEELALLGADDVSLIAVRAWLEACRGELANDEIVAWRLRKNVRSLAGFPEIFATAVHAWIDIEIVLDRLRESYRAARRAFRRAVDTRKIAHVHAFRRAVRKLRYQLELLASVEVPAAPAPAPNAPEGAAPEPPAPPPWLEAVRDLHRMMKSLARDLGKVSDLYALRSIVAEAEGDGIGFDPDRLDAILSELTDSHVERALIDAARAFAASPKKILITEPEPEPASAPAPAPAAAAPAPEPATPAAAQGE